MRLSSKLYSSSPPSISDTVMLKLSLDIFLLLFDLVDPFDIISIGQTCRILRELSLVRFVWVKALRRVVEANSLFKPVLNYEDDSVPLKFLQQAATFPKRMLALLDRNQSKPEKERRIAPFSTTTIRFLDCDPEKSEAEQELLLVPGGRFLLVLSISFSRLTVIDVDRYFEAKSRKENPLIAEYADSIHCRSNVGIFRASISNDGDTLFIVNSIIHSDSVDTFSLWQYDPSMNELRLKKSVHIETNRFFGIDTHYMASNLFIFMVDGIIYLWDFVDDKYIRWGATIDIGLHPTTPQIFTDGTRIILLDLESIRIWEIPSQALVPGPLINNQVPIIQYPPTFFFPASLCRTPAFVKKNEGVIISLDDWYSGPKHPLLFDTVTWRILDENLDLLEDLLVRQQFNITHFADGQEMPLSNNARTLITYTRIQGLWVNEDTHILPSMMCEGRIIMITCCMKTFFIMSTPGHMEDPTTEPDTVLPSELVSLGDHAKGHVFRQYNFDPCSGRLLQVATDGTSVMISDYLRAPNLIE